MDRDFTEADYEMLLALDRGPGPGAARPVSQQQMDRLPHRTFSQREPAQPVSLPACVMPTWNSGCRISFRPLKDSQAAGPACLPACPLAVSYGLGISVFRLLFTHWTLAEKSDQPACGTLRRSGCTCIRS